MSLSGTKCTRLILVLCNVIFSWISGGLLCLFGGASLYDPNYMQLFTLFTVGEGVPQSVFILFALCIIALGGFIITLGLFGCFGTLCDNQCIIRSYLYLLILVFFLELGLTAGCLYLYFAFPSTSSVVHDNLIRQVKENYGNPQELSFSSAMDFTQANFGCCGVDNYTDYDLSNWKSQLPNMELSVPPSCCSQIPISEMRTSTSMSSLSSSEDGLGTLGLKDEGDGSSTESGSSDNPMWWKRCQSMNPMESDDFLYTHGCWGNMEDIFLKHALFSAILFASLALLQILGVIFPICWLRRVEHKSRDIRVRTSRQSQPLL